MKLSEKGESRLYNSKNVFYDDDIEGDVVALWELSKVWEFEPDDFTGAVVLTVEEAELVNDVLDRFKHLGCGPFFGRCVRLSKSIQQRIEQAEKKNE